MREVTVHAHTRLNSVRHFLKRMNYTPQIGLLCSGPYRNLLMEANKPNRIVLAGAGQALHRLSTVLQESKTRIARQNSCCDLMVGEVRV